MVSRKKGSRLLFNRYESLAPWVATSISIRNQMKVNCVCLQDRDRSDTQLSIAAPGIFETWWLRLWCLLSGSIGWAAVTGTFSPLSGLLLLLPACGVFFFLDAKLLTIGDLNFLMRG